MKLIFKHNELLIIAFERTKLSEDEMYEMKKTIMNAEPGKPVIISGEEISIVHIEDNKKGPTK